MASIKKMVNAMSRTVHASRSWLRQPAYAPLAAFDSELTLMVPPGAHYSTVGGLQVRRLAGWKVKSATCHPHSPLYRYGPALLAALVPVPDVPVGATVFPEPAGQVYVLLAVVPDQVQAPLTPPLER